MTESHITIDIFNNREIAIGIWLSIGFVLSLSQKTIREALRGLWQAFFHRVILISVGLMAGYISLSVFLLSEIDFWDLCQLKNTILWSVSTAIVSMSRVVQTIDDKHYFKKIIQDNFKVIVAFEFVITFYTFPLWIELLIVPATAILVLIHTYTENKEEHAIVRKSAGFLLGSWGVGLTTYTVYNLTTNFGAIARLEALMDFLLPLELLLLFLPFLFFIALYTLYENVYLRLKIANTDVVLRRHAIRMALVHFHVRANFLKLWISNVRREAPITNRQELKTSIERTKSLASRSSQDMDI